MECQSAGSKSRFISLYADGAAFFVGIPKASGSSRANKQGMVQGLLIGKARSV
jgi:hypothetical protein